jgi:hypothetical protein
MSLPHRHAAPVPSGGPNPMTRTADGEEQRTHQTIKTSAQVHCSSRSVGPPANAGLWVGSQGPVHDVDLSPTCGALPCRGVASISTRAPGYPVGSSPRSDNRHPEGVANVSGRYLADLGEDGGPFVLDPTIRVAVLAFEDTAGVSGRRPLSETKPHPYFRAYRLLLTRMNTVKCTGMKNRPTRSRGRSESPRNRATRVTHRVNPAQDGDWWELVS